MGQPPNPPTVVVAALASPVSAEAVFASAREWSLMLDADLVLLHAGTTDARMRKHLDEFASRYSTPRVSVDLRPGDPRRVVPRAAAELHAALIVAGAGENPNASWSVSHHIARRSSCSVLLTQKAPQHGQRWVVAIQCENSSLPMLRLAGRMALRANPARIDVVSAYCLRGADWVLEGDMDDRGAKAQRARIRREEQARLAEFVADGRMGVPNVRTVCLSGRLAYAASEYAKNIAADLLIIEAPAPERLWNWLFGDDALPPTFPGCSVWLYRPAVELERVR